MQIKIVKLGRVRSKEILTLCADYQKRIRRFFPCDDIQLKASIGFVPDSKDWEEAFIVILDEHGCQWTNTELASNLQTWLDDRRFKRLLFVVGDAYGVPDSVKQRAKFQWSLSPLVFTNEHAFLLVHEQIYRSLMLLNGHAYHHE